MVQFWVVYNHMVWYKQLLIYYVAGFRMCVQLYSTFLFSDGGKVIL
jgi:hypothetical protein